MLTSRALYVAARYVVVRPRGHCGGMLDRTGPAEAHFIQLDRGDDTREYSSNRPD